MTKITSKISLLGVAVIAVLIGVVIAAAANSLLYPQDGTVGDVEAIAAYVDYEPWATGIPIHWGDLEPGQTYLKWLEVENVGSVPINVTFHVQGLPIDWTETWSANTSAINMDPGVTVGGTLQLIVPGGTPAGFYDWTSFVNCTQT